MANFQLNQAMRSFTDLDEAARTYDAVFDAWTRAETCCRSTSTASVTNGWSRIWRARCGPCSISSACPGTEKVLDNQAARAGARPCPHRQLFAGRRADLQPRRRPLAPLSRPARAGAADPRALGGAAGLRIDERTALPGRPRGYRRARGRGAAHEAGGASATRRSLARVVARDATGRSGTISAMPAAPRATARARSRRSAEARAAPAWRRSIQSGQLAEPGRSTRAGAFAERRGSANPGPCSN